MSDPAPKSPSQWDTAKRWTRDVAADGFAAVPTAFLEHYHSLGLSSSEAMFVVHLLSHKWNEKNPFPRFSRIALRMGMTETAVRNHARSLEKKKLLKRIARPGSSNEFDLSQIFQRLEELRSEAIKQKMKAKERGQSA